MRASTWPISSTRPRRTARTAAIPSPAFSPRVRRWSTRSTAGTALAGVPLTLTHQGRLFDAAGKPFAGPVPITFNLYNSAKDGTPKISETIMVTVEDGYFSASVGEINPLDGFFDGQVKFIG